ncbi:MAG: hypothetical protein Q8O92_02745 [Candidatus Latescibacter sp.]|nr:hypothetical protein [Candidatus Latescibacter sp.]
MGRMVRFALAACWLASGMAHGVEPQVNGFAEWRGGLRLRDDNRQSDNATLNEVRLQLDSSASCRYVEFRAKADLIYDGIDNKADVDPREISASFSPVHAVDLKIGRQILTWGTGDYLFINDLFPKDWKSFLLGRDDEYLKAPSDAVKASFFMALVNLDVVYTPLFDPDRFIDGERISFFNPALGRMAGEDDALRVQSRNDWFADDEIAARLTHSFGSYEAALYAYNGFWKSPMGFDATDRRATFPPLGVYGASVRGNILKGVGSVEAGYYDSFADRNGHNPSIPNSQSRFLVGYEQELFANFTAGGQYYVEHMMDYSAYRASLTDGMAPSDEDRHVVTLRLTQLAFYQNLRLSLFVFYSPSDRDAYLRPTAHYRVNDHWSVSAGGNLFSRDEHTFFGQFEEAANVYLGMRYAF